MKKRSLFVLIPFYLLTTTSLFPQQQRENAALFLPRSMSGLQGDEAQILISTLEEELSTRFNLIARSAVNRAFKQAVSSLPQEQCTEENCLLRMQEILEVNLIFTFGVLKSDMTTLLTLQLQEGPQKVVKNEICNSPCNTPILISGVKDLVQRLLSERDKNRSPQSYGDPGISLFEQEIQVEEGGLMGTLNLSLKAPPFGEVIISYEEMPMGFLEIDPKEIVFNESNWDQEQSLQIYALNNDKMDGDRDAGLIFKVKETKDMNYSFAPPVEARVKIKDDDTDGEMRLLTIPSGASVFVDGKPLLDIDKKPVLSPHNLRLKRGKRVIRIKREGHNEETFSVNVTKKRMGTRVVNLTPLVASLRLRVPDRYSFSDLFIDGEKRLSFKGRTSIQSKLPPGVYTLHVVSDNAESESRTMNLKGGSL